MISKVSFESQKWGPVILRGHCVAKLVYISRLEETSDWVSIGRTNKANICVFMALLLQSMTYFHVGRYRVCSNHVY